MDRRCIRVATMAALVVSSFSAVSTAGHAQTTIITQDEKDVVTTETGSTHAGHRRPHRATTHRAARRAPSASPIASRARPPATEVRRDVATEGATATTSVDRTTVIHQDENGDVTHRTTIERQNADGSTTVVQHTSAQTAGSPADGAPPAPAAAPQP